MEKIIAYVHVRAQNKKLYVKNNNNNKAVSFTSIQRGMNARDLNSNEYI